MTLITSPLSSRNQFGKMLNEMGLVGTAVEIGTHRGEFARALLTQWKGEKLYCVDPWENLLGYSKEQVMALTGCGHDREYDYSIARKVTSHFANRISFFRETSQQALGHFPIFSLDFVYIDGDHSYEVVEADIFNWWKKLRTGGVLAGHDFVCPGEANGGWGKDIQRAVLEFFGHNNEEIHLIVEEGGLPWSFYVVKR